MSENEVFTLQEIVAECRKEYPVVIKEMCNKIVKLQGNIIFKKDDSLSTTENLLSLKWPESLKLESTEIVEKEVTRKLKEQLKLIILLQKEEKDFISNVVNSVYKNK